MTVAELKAFLARCAEDDIVLLADAHLAAASVGLPTLHVPISPHCPQVPPVSLVFVPARPTQLD